MTKFVFNPLQSEELQLLASSGDPIVLLDTRAGILARTPTAGVVALSSDEPAMYIADGTKWVRHPIILGAPSTGIDMGAEPFNDDKGYGARDLSGKDLHNTVVAGYDENINGIREGAIRYTPSVKKLTGYVNGAWRNFLAYSDAEEDAIILWTDVWNTYDSFGRNIIHGHTVDMGLFATDHIFHGGVISSQVI